MPPVTPTPDAEDNTTNATRKKKCPGCQRNHDIHTFGPPGRNCQGPISPNSSTTHSPNRTRAASRDTSPIAEKNPNAGAMSDEQLNQYRQHLQLLKNQESELLESITNEQENFLREENTLKEEIKRQTEKLERLKAARNRQPRSATPPANQNNLPRSGETRSTESAIFSSSVSSDNMSTLLHRPLLSHQQTSGSSFGFAATGATVPLLNSGLNGQDPSFVNRQFTQNELFLRPTRTNDITRGKALRIVDFVSRIRPAEDEKVLSYDNNCKLALILQDSKRKLSSVSIEQYSIANLRVFYELLFSGKLSTLLHVQEYLSYAIKILELATKYTWQSVLQYDDEFRILQHTYGFSWSTDHSHLHEVVLIPRWAAKLHRGSGHSLESPKNPSDFSSKGLSNIVSHLLNGSEICRMFNSRKGCQKSPCKFSHACNRIGSCWVSATGCSSLFVYHSRGTIS